MINEQKDLIMTICIWFSRLAILNLLIILSTIIGGIIFGIGPAVSTALVILKQWKDGKDVPLISYYFKVYKELFVSSNRIMLFGGPLLTLIGFDAYYMVGLNGPLSTIGFMIFIYLLLVISLTLLYSLSSSSRHFTKVNAILKNSLVDIFLFPKQSLTILSGLLIVGFLSIKWNVLFIFFTWSLILLIVVLTRDTISFKDGKQT
ncbi:DUF624 domain-containing protein [Peribacillus muralis]|uniref:DUF624 domain-containing protein n=1 Tax=Peribacillus muralis TaxID=264697 RepID=UPI0007098A7E|nr:DUF624 domain-containing protein [Peribacillus muralis]